MTGAPDWLVPVSILLVVLALAYLGVAATRGRRSVHDRPVSTDVRWAR